MQLAPGNYHGKVTGAIIIEAGADKLPMMKVQCDVTFIWQNNEWVALPTQEQVEVKLFLNDKSWPYSEKKLAFLGFNGEFASPQFSGVAVDDGVALTCSHKKSDDGTKTYDNWDLSEWGGGSSQVSEDVVHLLNAQWKQGAGAYKESPAAPAPPTAPPVEDEPPF